LNNFEVQTIDGENVSIALSESVNGNRRHTCILVLMWRLTVRLGLSRCLVDMYRG